MFGGEGLQALDSKDKGEGEGNTFCLLLSLVNACTALNGIRLKSRPAPFFNERSLIIIFRSPHGWHYNLSSRKLRPE